MIVKATPPAMAAFSIDPRMVYRLLPIEVVSILMGHSSIDITAKYYINVDAERRRTAIEKIVSMTLTKKSDEDADTNDKT